MKKTPKHVIFLGAGASKNSGYPLAEELKLRLSSIERTRARIQELLKQDSGAFDVLGKYNEWVLPLADIVRFFREGGFSSIDEFCYLCRSAKREEIAGLKRLLQLELSFHNPEEHFTESDYYPFVQKLFKPDELFALRDDVVVVSFNYDPYLDWLLMRAVQARRKAISVDKSSGLDWQTTSLVTSAFLDRSCDTLQKTDRFCLLKLHGTIAWPSEIIDGTGQLRGPAALTISAALKPSHSARLRAVLECSTPPPLLFPWELFGNGGAFVGKDSFALSDEANEAGYKPGGSSVNSPHLHDLFRAIWQRARDEVQAAKKVSFVGLSMHSYLNDAMKFLFEGKEGDVELTVTDYRSDRLGMLMPIPLIPFHSPAARIGKLLPSIAPQLRWNHGVRDHFSPYEKEETTTNRVKVLRTFREFIETEM